MKNNHSINLKIPTLLLPLIFLISCTPYTEKHQTMEKTDCSQGFFHFLSQEELDSLSKDPRRSVETIKKLFTKVKPEIISFFEGRDSLFKNTDSLSINITVSYNGKLIPLKSGKSGFDSLTGDELKAILEPYYLDSFDSLTGDEIMAIREPYYLDSIKDHSFVARFHINIQKTSAGLNCIMKKDVDYYQGRSKLSIMRIVMYNLSYLRYAYNRRLRKKPGLKGRITVKFAVDEHGKVIFSKAIETTMQDEKLENIVADIITTWEFCPINNKGDVTEVVYPFVFSQ